MRLSQLKEEVLIKRLGMLAPDVEIDGKASILISSDEEETKGALIQSLGSSAAQAV